MHLLGQPDTVFAIREAQNAVRHFILNWKEPTNDSDDDNAPGPHTVALLAALLATARKADRQLRRHKRRRTH